ncbi:histidine kinase/DNA gyrase B/HSP90-like ATPase [Anaerobacterium chartisolvens]|uniref:Histidine kinase/DNA gyrase B/HSP90-like ATPase n=1 Tax=Anaerobacterium chartisolvens TaxID=1297424 RepID=A0A369AEU4_9FIRM|nr:sensor histidine kinase [Anaerobacterium chartisolvens]RCX07870.1 histidine kinase/DNA gyrase B/HSP90-like ATPase [Anaerobacterium chartisolvens]
MNCLVSKFNDISLRTKIFIFYAAILLASLSVFAFLTIGISNRTIVEKATKNAERELALINNSLLNLAQSMEDYVRILSTDNRLQNQLERMKGNELDSLDNIEVEKTFSTVISNVTQPTTRIAAASIMSSKQKLFEIGFVDNSSIYPVFDNDTVDFIIENKTPVWIGLIKMKYKYVGNENVFAITKPIIGLDTGHILGTAILYLKETDIAAIYLNNIVNKDDKFYIVDEQNSIISTQDKNELYQKFDNERYLGEYKLQEISHNKSLIRNIGDKRALIAVQDFKKLNWKIVSVISLDEITHENKRMTQLIIVFGAICLISAFIASYLLSYTISKPILKLVNIMKEIKSGNLKLRADFNVKGEIGMLGDGFNSLMDKINILLEQIYNEQKLKRENEFKLLQSQIKPHFLYNTIETIISFIKLDLKENAVMTAKYLAGFYRVSLSKGDDIITIRDEIQLIDNYLSIQKLRYVEYLDYKLDFEEEILKYRIPKLTLQPLVENSIYHGLKQKDTKGILTIRGYCEHDLIKIEVMDDGIGMSQEQINRVLNRPSKHHKSTDFGVHSVDSRLKLLYGDQYGISIESKVQEYTKVIVRLPAVAEEGG